MKFRAKVELFRFPQYHEEGELAIMATLKDWLGNNLDKDGYVQGYYADGYILGGLYEATNEYIDFEWWVPVYEDTLEKIEVAE